MIRPNKENGFSLLEVMIALAIFSIGILACYNMQILSIGQNSTSNRIGVSSSWASKTIENLLSLPFSHAKLQDKNADKIAGLSKTSLTGGCANSTADYCEQSPDGVYTLTWNVADDEPLAKKKSCSKIIRVIVTNQRWGAGRAGKVVDMEYVKTKNI